MQDLLAFVVIMVVAVGGAEIVRAVCSKRLAAPTPVRVRAEPPAPEVTPVTPAAVSNH